MIETALAEQDPEVAVDGPVLLAPLAVEAAALRLGVGAGGRVVRVGMGAERATASLARLRASLPPTAPVAVVGFGGGMSATQRPGDVVVATELVTEDGSLAPRPLDRSLADSIACEIGRRLPRVAAGTVVCCRRIVPGGELARLAATSGALACEMESAWLAPLGEMRPFAVVRVILDLPGRGLFTPWTLINGSVALARLKNAAAATVRALTVANQ